MCVNFYYGASVLFDEPIGKTLFLKIRMWMTQSELLQKLLLSLCVSISDSLFSFNQINVIFGKSEINEKWKFVKTC